MLTVQQIIPAPPGWQAVFSTNGRLHHRPVAFWAVVMEVEFNHGIQMSSEQRLTGYSAPDVTFGLPDDLQPDFIRWRYQPYQPEHPSENADESEKLLRGFLSKKLYDSGLYCRTDDRGDPVIQLAPPLIANQEHFDEIEGILRAVLTEACELIF